MTAIEVGLDVEFLQNEIAYCDQLLLQMKEIFKDDSIYFCPLFSQDQLDGEVELELTNLCLPKDIWIVQDIDSPVNALKKKLSVMVLNGKIYTNSFSFSQTSDGTYLSVNKFRFLLLLTFPPRFDRKDAQTDQIMKFTLFLNLNLNKGKYMGGEIIAVRALEVLCNQIQSADSFVISTLQPGQGPDIPEFSLGGLWKYKPKKKINMPYYTFISAVDYKHTMELIKKANGTIKNEQGLMIGKDNLGHLLQVQFKANKKNIVCFVIIHVHQVQVPVFDGKIGVWWELLFMLAVEISTNQSRFYLAIGSILKNIFHLGMNDLGKDFSVRGLAIPLRNIFYFPKTITFNGPKLNPPPITKELLENVISGAPEFMGY